MFVHDAERNVAQALEINTTPASAGVGCHLTESASAVVASAALEVMP